MKQEDKQLLLQDLSSRLPYGVKVSLQYGGKQLNGMLDAVYPTEERVIVDELSEAIAPIDVKCGGFILDENNITPYLRPMSSMTEKERKELNNQGYTKIAGELYHYCALDSNNAFYNPERHPYVRMEYVIKLIDWLNAHHFDYRGLIERGLALEAPEEMYNIK